MQLAMRLVVADNAEKLRDPRFNSSRNLFEVVASGVDAVVGENCEIWRF